MKIQRSMACGALAFFAMLACTLSVQAGSGSGTFDELWHMSSAGNNPTTDTTGTDQPVATIQAKPLINEKKDDRLASLDGSMAEWLLVQRQRSLAEQQQLALTSLNTTTGQNETALSTLSRRAMLEPARGWYDVYGVFHPYRSAGYVVDEQQLTTDSGDYFRTVSYVPRVIYTTPYVYRGCYNPCYQPCYKPVYRPCYGPYKPVYRPCGYRYGSPLTVRATGNWGFVNYRSGGYCYGPSLKVRINID